MRTTLLILIALLCMPRIAGAVKVADITRIGGQRSNVLTGLGLVYGLKGTGDGGDFLPAIRPLAGVASEFSHPAAGDGTPQRPNRRARFPQRHPADHRRPRRA